MCCSFFGESDVWLWNALFCFLVTKSNHHSHPSNIKPWKPSFASVLYFRGCRGHPTDRRSLQTGSPFVFNCSVNSWIHNSRARAFTKKTVLFDCAEEDRIATHFLWLLVDGQTFSASFHEGLHNNYMQTDTHAQDLKNRTEHPLRANSSVIITVDPTKAEITTHGHTHTLNCMHLHLYSQKHHRPYTRPFVHSQGIFQWAKPPTGYTAAGTSAQCMSIKLSHFLSFFSFSLISCFPKLW